MNKKAKEILFDTYWTNEGWKNENSLNTPKADFEYAKKKGVMFEPLTISKTEILNRLKEIVDLVPIKKVTDAFFE